MIKPDEQSVFLQNAHYFFAQTDGSYAFPNSAEGDLLKQAKKEIESLSAELKRYKDANYVIVPKIPTQKMIAAGKHTLKGAADELFESIVAECVYMSMIAEEEQSK